MKHVHNYSWNTFHAHTVTHDDSFFAGLQMLIDRHGQAARALNFESGNGNGSHGNANGGGHGVGGSRDGNGASCDLGRDHELRDTYRGMVQVRNNLLTPL